MVSGGSEGDKRPRTQTAAERTQPFIWYNDRIHFLVYTLRNDDKKAP